MISRATTGINARRSCQLAREETGISPHYFFPVTVWLRTADVLPAKLASPL